MGSGRHHGAAVLLGADLLVGDDRHHQHQTGHVGEGAGDHHAQAADGQDDTQHPVDLLVQMAVQGRRDGKDAQQSADADLRHLPPAGDVFKQQRRTVGEDVRHDKGGDGQLGGVDAGLHGVGLGDGRAGIGRQGHRGRDIRHGDGEETEACIAFTGCPWYTYWCLTDTWSDNSVLIQGPQAFYWGGTGLAATANCSDKELARQIIYYTTCNTESMVAINTANGDYVNNKAAIDYIKENGSGTTSTYKTAGGQDIIGFFADKCDGINVLAVGEDQVICEQLLPAAVDAYIANGDLDAALTDFAASIHDKYSYLNVK